MTHDQSTLQPRTQTRTSDADAATVLTILGHPDIRRIGERALLSTLDAGRDVDLSRTDPEFSRPEAIWNSQPLDDPFLSRIGVTLRAARDGVVVRRGESAMEVRVDCESLDDERLIDAQTLARGVVFELARRVVLLLHRLPKPPAPPRRGTDDLGMIGASASLDGVRNAVLRVADLDLSVLIRGESGTGKELVARAIHRRSSRARQPFIAVNLGAIPQQLALAELFGHVKGAFTGATGTGVGYFGAAEGGTLFLDEVGEAPPEVQVMLLRALESGEVSPVGSPRGRPVDVRILAATDADLEDQVDSGAFKAPLLHRLSAYEIRLPPLRQRRDDFGRLFLHFALEEMKQLGETPPGLDDPHPSKPWIPAKLLGRLARYPWPGNIRELRNVVRQLVIDSRGLAQLTPSPRIESLLAAGPAHEATPPSTGDSDTSKRRPAEIGREELATALRACAFEPAKAARALGITRPSIYNLIREHPTLRTAEEVPDDELHRALERHDGDVRAAALDLEVSARALGRRLKKDDARR